VILTVAFSYAEDNGLIEKNFMNKVKLPNEANITKDTKEPVFLTTDERKMLEAEADRKNTNKIHRGKIGTPFYGITAKVVVFLLHTGLRMGELIGLLWEDVDMERGFLHIKHNVPTTKKEVTTPKRKASIRNIPLDKVASGIIEDLSSDKKGKHVFHTKSGGMINRKDADRTLKTMLKRAGIEKNPTLHDLRHTYASELIRNGVDMKTVSVVLGHSDISTTMNIYVHKSDDDLEGLKSILE
jgi:integrase